MRKAKPKKRVILPDPVFNDQKVSKFVNHLMYDGKKNASYEIFYAALETVKAKLPNEEKSALEIWKKALDNVVSLGLSCGVNRSTCAIIRKKRRFVKCFSSFLTGRRILASLASPARVTGYTPFV